MVCFECGMHAHQAIELVPAYCVCNVRFRLAVLEFDSYPPLFKHSLVSHGVPSFRVDDLA